MLKEPTSMEDCVYFTRRVIGNGKIAAWVFKEKCKKCGKGMMGKPRDPKTGRPKIRSEEYVCSECDNTEGKKEYEEKLTCNIKYSCPYCGFSGEIQIPFIRKKVSRIKEETGKRESVDSLRFQCEKCKKNIDITKKMK